jgi:hypothetical protein
VVKDKARVWFKAKARVWLVKARVWVWSRLRIGLSG